MSTRTPHEHGNRSAFETGLEIVRPAVGDNLHTLLAALEPLEHEYEGFEVRRPGTEHLPGARLMAKNEISDKTWLPAASLTVEDLQYEILEAVPELNETVAYTFVALPTIIPTKSGEKFLELRPDDASYHAPHAQRKRAIAIIEKIGRVTHYPNQWINRRVRHRLALGYNGSQTGVYAVIAGQEKLDKFAPIAIELGPAMFPKRAPKSGHKLGAVAICADTLSPADTLNISLPDADRTTLARYSLAVSDGNSDVQRDADRAMV